jgi:Fe-S-cluster-containing hydrogenase component 2
MCPTGALSKSNDKLRFDTLSCTGCGLCEEFCMEGAIHIQNGIPLGEGKTVKIQEEASVT